MEPVKSVKIHPDLPEFSPTLLIELIGPSLALLNDLNAIVGALKAKTVPNYAQTAGDLFTLLNVIDPGLSALITPTELADAETAIQALGQVVADALAKKTA